MTTQTISIQSAVSTIQSCTGLDENSAYTLITYASLTYLKDRLDEFPTLVIMGMAQTGKSTALKIFSELACNAGNIISQPTPAVLRDSMISSPTLIVEEADGIDETLLHDRYSKQNLRPTNRNTGGGVFKMNANESVYGATAIHRRRPFKDASVDSKCVMIHSIRKPINKILRYATSSLKPLIPMLEQAALTFPHLSIFNLPASRADYNWGLLSLIATQLTYTPSSYTQFIADTIKESQEILTAGSVKEPIVLVFNNICAMCIVVHTDPTQPPLVTQYRLLVKDLTKYINESIINPDELIEGHQVAILARRAGFNTKIVGGRSYIYLPDLTKLQTIATQLGLHDYTLVH